MKGNFNTSVIFQYFLSARGRIKHKKEFQEGYNTFTTLVHQSVLLKASSGLCASFC